MAEAFRIWIGKKETSDAVMVMGVMDLAVAPLSLLQSSLNTTPFEPFIFSREQIKFMGQ